MPSRKRKPSGRPLYWALPLALIAVFAIIGYLLIMAPHRQNVRKTHEAPSSHVAPKPPERPVEPGPSMPESRPRYRARVAIVIDDLGSDMAAIDGVLGLPAPVSVAVLPGMPYSKKCALAASGAGRDVLLHLPMQPKGESMKGLGPGALMEGMDGQNIARTVEQDLDSVPGAIGVNNHMGSHLTEDGESMTHVMEVLGRRGLFFLDSRTTAASVAVEAARLHKVPAASRSVFLDDADDVVEIKKQFDRLVDLSIRNGEAIAIGHPRSATLKVLSEELPGLREKGIEVVRVSMLVR